MHSKITKVDTVGACKYRTNSIYTVVCRFKILIIMVKQIKMVTSLLLHNQSKNFCNEMFLF